MRSIPKISFVIAVFGLFLSADLVEAGITGGERLRPGKGFHQRQRERMSQRSVRQSVPVSPNTRYYVAPNIQHQGVPTPQQYVAPRQTPSYRIQPPVRTVVPQPNSQQYYIVVPSPSP